MHGTDMNSAEPKHLARAACVDDDTNGIYVSLAKTNQRIVTFIIVGIVSCQ